MFKYGIADYHMRGEITVVRKVLDVKFGVQMITSSNGNIFRVTGHLCGELTGHKGQWRGALMFSLICDWINGWVNHCEAGDLRRHRTYFDVTVMQNHSTVINSTIINRNSKSYLLCDKLGLLKHDKIMKWISKKQRGV